MRKTLPLFLIAAALIITSFVPEPPARGKVNWISMKELKAQYSQNPKPIIVDVYTSWCGWCKVMDKRTYTDKKLADYINDKFYAVKFDAESRESFEFANKSYSYNETDRINSLADYLLSGRLEFPTTVFLSSLSAIPAPLSGYMKPAEMEAPLKYFGEGAFEKQTFADFSKTMKKEWQ